MRIITLTVWGNDPTKKITFDASLFAFAVDYDNAAQTALWLYTCKDEYPEEAKCQLITYVVENAEQIRKILES